MGENDWRSKKNLGLNVSTARDIKADSRSTLHTDGRGGRYHQCQTSRTSVN